jgi:signal transduction histidine kinase
MSQMMDGDLPPDQATELQQLLSSDARARESFVDLLALDTLLAEELGRESMTALVDLLADAEAPRLSPPDANAVVRWLPPHRSRKFVGWVTAAVVIIAALIATRSQNKAQASPASIVQAAVEMHAAAVERIYAVKVSHENEKTEDSDGLVTRDARVVTQGDRFYVEMNRGQREWVWGRDARGAIWLTLGQRRGLVVEPEEVDKALERMISVYSLNVETLLREILGNFELERADVSSATHVIIATPRPGKRSLRLRRAQVEIDRETKAIRRLILYRDLPRQGPSTVDFTLIEARPADESRFRPEGHLLEPHRLYTIDSRPDTRGEILANWLGAASNHWIKLPSEKENAK